MRVLVTGTRHVQKMNGPDVVLEAIQEVAPEGERLTIIHGASPGADALASHAASVLGANEYRFPAHWRTHGKAAGPIRNQEMLDTLRPDVVLAFPSPESRGTYDMIDRARQAGIRVVVVPQGVD